MLKYYNSTRLIRATIIRRKGKKCIINKATSSSKTLHSARWKKCNIKK